MDDKALEPKEDLLTYVFINQYYFCILIYIDKGSSHFSSKTLFFSPLERDYRKPQMVKTLTLGFPFQLIYL